jgi:hypothetical protein
MKDKDMFQLTEREKAILAIAGNISIIMPCKALVGICKDDDEKYVSSNLLAITDSKGRINLQFYSNMYNYESEEEYKEYAKFCKKYLEGFLNKSLLINSDDEKIYSPSLRAGTIEVPSSWDATTCLYTLSNHKIPNYIDFNWKSNNLEEISEELEQGKFDFRYHCSNLRSSLNKNILDLRLSDLKKSVIMEI